MPTPRTGLHARPATELRTCQRPPAPTRPSSWRSTSAPAGPRWPCSRPPGASWPTPSAGRPPPDRRRRSRAVAPRLVGGHRHLGPPGPGRERGGARSGSSASAAPRSGRAPCPSTATATAIGPPSSGWTPGAPTPSARRCGARSTCRATRPPKLARWVRRTRRHPEPVGQGPGRPHPLPARAAPRGLPRRRRLPGAGRLPQPAPDRAWPGRHTTPSRCTGSPTTVTSAPSPTTTRWSSWPAWIASTLPELVPTGSVLGGLAPGAAAELGLLAGDAGRGRNRRPALGRGRLGRRGRLRRAPLHRHLELGQLPRPVQEDRRPDQHRLHPLGAPGPLPDRRRARDRWGLPDLAARQRPLSRRRPAGGPAQPPRRRRLRHAQRRGGLGARRRPRGPVHPLAQRRALAGRRPHHPRRLPQPVALVDAGPTWCGPSSRGWR